MRITSIHLTDVGPFTAYKTLVTGTMVGVTGRNGAGKSTLLRAVAFAVSGDSARFGRRDATRIGAAGPNQPGVVVGFDSFSGAAVTVGRWLPTDKLRGKHRLVVGDTVLTTDEAVTAWLEAELGVTVQAAQDVMFVPQGCLTDVVTAPPAKRAEMLQRAFGLEAAARGYRAAVEHLQSLPAPPDAAAADAARVNLAEINGHRAKATQDLLAVPAVDPDRLELARTVLARARRLDSLLPIRDRTVRELGDIAELLSTPEPTGPADADVDRARAVLDAATAHRTSAAHAAQLDALVRESGAALGAAERDRPLDPGPVPREPARLTELRAMASALAAVTALPVGTPCPVCEAPITFVHDRRRREADALLAELARLEREFRAATAAHERARAAHADAVRAVDRARARHDRNLADRAQTAVAADPGVTVPAAEAAYRDLVRAQAAARADRDARARAADRGRALVRDLEGIDAEAATGHAPGDVAAAQEFVTWADGHGDRRRALDAKLQVLDQAAAAAQALYDRIETVRRTADSLAAHRKVVQEVVATLHRDAAPAAAAAAAMASLEGDINRRLDQIRADYRVHVGPDGEIDALFADGSPDRRAGLLSPGQQMVLALAWRVAIVDRYSPRAGLICLDEPTTGLDEPRILALRAALDAWRAADDGLQFLVVTHDRRLTGAFDQVIDLS